MEKLNYNTEYYRNVTKRIAFWLKPIRREPKCDPGKVLIPYYNYSQICKYWTYE